MLVFLRNAIERLSATSFVPIDVMLEKTISIELNLNDGNLITQFLYYIEY